MKDNCIICNNEVEIEGKPCCTGVDCPCGGQEIRKDEDNYTICCKCYDVIEQLNEKGFIVKNELNGEVFDIYETTELI